MPSSEQAVAIRMKSFRRLRLFQRILAAGKRSSEDMLLRALGEYRSENEERIKQLEGRVDALEKQNRQLVANNAALKADLLSQRTSNTRYFGNASNGSNDLQPANFHSEWLRSYVVQRDFMGGR